MKLLRSKQIIAPTTGVLITAILVLFAFGNFFNQLQLKFADN